MTEPAWSGRGPGRCRDWSWVLARLARLFEGSDRGLVSLGPEHILPAPAVLAIAAIHDELTDSSAG